MIEIKLLVTDMKVCLDPFIVFHYLFCFLINRLYFREDLVL